MTEATTTLAQGDTDFAYNSEPHFKYLNRSARPEVGRLREAIEQWFSRFPEKDRPDLRMRLRSRDDLQHEAAAFELILHELLLKLGCSVETHPEVPSAGTRRPDFLATPSSGSPFYVEATLATGDTKQSIGARTRLNDAFDAIDRLETVDFFLHVEISGEPASPPPGRKIRDWLKPKIDALNREYLAQHAASGQWEALPRWEWVHDGLTLRITAIPKTRPSVAAPDRLRAIGSKMGGLTYGSGDECLRKAVEEKSSAYGDLPLAYILAINTLQHTDDIDLGNAFFGTEVSIVSQKPDGTPGPLSPTRNPNGVWAGPTGPRRTGISGLLLFHRLAAWSAGNAPHRLYHHPWGERPVPEALLKLSQGRLPAQLIANPTRPMPWGNPFALTQGPLLGELLSLPTDFPY